MKRILSYMTILLLGVGLAFAGGRLVSLDKKITGGKELIQIKGENNLPLPDFYPSSKDPSLLILEFSGIDSSAISGLHKFQQGTVKWIKISSKDSKSFLKVKFAKLRPFSIYARENSIIIEIENSSETKASSTPVITTTGTVTLKDIILQKNNGLRIKLLFSGSAPIYRSFLLKRDPVHGKPIRLVIDLPGAKTRKMKKIVGKEGITVIRTGQFSPKIARVVLDLSKVPDYKIERNGHYIEIKIPSYSLKEKITKEKTVVTKPVPGPSLPGAKPQVKPSSPPVAKLPSPSPKEDLTSSKPTTIKRPTFQTVTIAGGEKKYYGEKYTFRFKDADIRDVVTFIAKLAHLNVIFDPGVEGKVTCELVDIPWDQALDLILKTNKLGYIIEGNVLRVAPMDVLAKEAQQREKMKEAAMPLQTVMRSLSYASAPYVQKILKKYLSARGEIVVDERTNTLIIKDTPDRLKAIDGIINALDAPIPQVSIQARIVETTASYTRNLGIQWGFMGYANPYYGNQTNLVFPNRIMIDGTPIDADTSGGLINPLNGYAINLPAASFNSALGISLGNITDSFALDVGLTAMEEEGWGKILSTPKISAQDNQEAKIRQGRQIPVQTNINNTIMVRYINAVLELDVTPHITADQNIIMKINIKNDSADFTKEVMGIPTIITQSAETVMMVKDGQTAVIGGMYRIENNTNQKKTPFLSSIPLIGDLLFKNSSITRTNRELLIFLTPKIIRK